VDQLRQRSRHDPLIEEVEVRIRLGTGGQELARQGEEVRFALDSLLEGDGFEPSVPDRQSVIAWLFRNSGADLLESRRFESISLQRGVSCEPDFLEQRAWRAEFVMPTVRHRSSRDVQARGEVCRLRRVSI